MAWFRFRSALDEGRLPSREIQDGLMIVFAAALLLTPGLLTDAVGFVLLIPPGRELVRRWLLARVVRGFDFQVTISDGVSGQPTQRDWPQQVSLHGTPLNHEPLRRQQRGSEFTIDAEAVQRKR